MPNATEIPKQRSTYYLTPATRKKLRYLAADFNLSFSETIEALIERASHHPGTAEALSHS